MTPEAAEEEKILAAFREISRSRYGKLVVIVRNSKVFRVFKEQETIFPQQVREVNKGQ